MNNFETEYRENEDNKAAAAVENTAEQVQTVQKNGGQMPEGIGHMRQPDDVVSDAIRKGGEVEPADEAMMKWWADRSAGQQSAAIDRATQSEVQSLAVQQEQADRELREQREQTDLEEARALDNQVLYAEARGDRGGIGQSQYARIQNNAMRNRQAIREARSRIAAETAVQMEQLRSQGEFQKAQQLLELNQSYLDRLTELQRWNAEYALDRDELDLAISQVTGQNKGKPIHEVQEEQTLKQVELALAALQRGVTNNEVRTILESYYGMSLESIAQALQIEAKKASTVPINGPLTDISIDRKQGIYMWAGTRFENLDEMEKAINQTGLTDEEIEELNRNAAKYNIQFEAVRE